MIMKRTINEIYRDRLVAEAEEAENRGMVKIAENITRQLERAPVRDKTASYTYNNESFEQDVQDALWDAVIRTADFHGVFISASRVQGIVEAHSKLLLDDIRKTAGIPSSIGAYEDKLIGEYRDSSVIEVEED